MAYYIGGNMRNYSEEINKMSGETLRIIKDLIQKCAKCDQTITAQVVEIVTAQKVRVKYNNSVFTASTTIPCEIGDIVRATAPCGNWSDLFVVVNKGKRLK